MRKIILLGGMVLMAAGVATLIFRMPKQVAAQHLAGAAEPIDPAPLSKAKRNLPVPLIKPWRDLREEMALP
jgi:hypothetical protein